ncbi:MAG: RNA 2',3'-cyclic phosphodiesterase [Thermodesulfobacteriota bacterium]
MAGSDQVKAAQNVRAFIALPLPWDVRSHLRRVQAELKKQDWPVKWVQPDNIHLTLKFLGDVPETDIPAIRQAMEAAADGFGAIRLSAGGLGAFPGVKRPRVIWCGVSGDLEALKSLHESLETELAALGIEKEGRAFKGHLTLGRVKGRVPPEALVDAVTRHGQAESPFFTGDCLYLYQSRLKPGGPEYRELACVRLTAA